MANLTTWCQKLLACGFLLQGSAWALGADPIAIWNANTSSVVSYVPFTPDAKPGDWVYLDARQLHPTQICLGYREANYKAVNISTLEADKAAHDPQRGLYPYLAKKDIPIIIGDDGTPYLTDGHHTLAALLASTQHDKTAFGHVLASFYRKPQAEFVAFMVDPKNNDAYLYGPTGNGLTNFPAALEFFKLPGAIYSDSPAGRMANDPYRSLGWGMKDSGYISKPKGGATRNAEILFENFIEFRWADLYRHKIMWNDASDDSFYVAVANADALAHSELTTDLTRGYAARDLPGYTPAETGAACRLNVTNETYINGDIAPSAASQNTLAVNAKADTNLVISGRLSNLARVEINNGGTASPSLEKGQFNPVVIVPPGSGLVVLAAESDYSGPTHIKAGNLMVNGSIGKSPVFVETGAVLSGSGRVGEISGSGLVSPGSSLGILTAPALDPTGGVRLAFEISAAGEPNYTRPLNSRNDLLVLTSAESFPAPMTARNEIDVYFKVDGIHPGDTFVGGIFAATSGPFTSELAGATIHYFLADASGPVVFGKNRYRPIDPVQHSFLVEINPVTAGFSSGPVKGYVTRFIAAPARAAAK